MKNKIKSYALIVASSSLLAASSASAANTFYAPGDLVLFFQQQGGSTTVYANLGNAATLYRGSVAGTAGSDYTLSNINFLDLNTTLESAFGLGWADDTTLYAGLAGVWGTSNTNLVALQDGDPHRTLYASKSRTAVGTVGVRSSTAWVIASDSSMTTGASNIQAQNNVLENSYITAVAESPIATSLIDNQNLFISPGVQGAAFGVFAGGVSQRGSATAFGTFAEAGQVEFALDLYRILGTAVVPGQVAGVDQTGSYEGTVTLGSNGMVSFVVPEPSSTALIGLAAGAFVFRRRRSA